MHVLSGLLDYSITRPSARRSNLTSTSHQHDEIGKCRSRTNINRKDVNPSESDSVQVGLLILYQLSEKLSWVYEYTQRDTSSIIRRSAIEK